MRVLACVCLTLLLLGCSKPGGVSHYAEVANAPALSKPEDKGAAQTTAATASSPMLAYAYQIGLEAPASRIHDLVAKHENACNAVGPAVCQVTATDMEQTASDQVSATLKIKATPTWLTNFREELAADAKAAGGRLTKTSVASEDLSVQIVDVDAHVRAQTALRDRLQDALAHRPGKTSDLVDVATALAKAQGDLDATQSELALLRQRVATSEMTIEYSASQGLASESAWAPLADAAHGFLRMVVTAMAAMITLVGLLLPWAIVIGGIVWLVLKFRNRRSRRNSQQTPRPPTV